MTDVQGVEEFLRLENASQQLLEELTALRKETVTFKEAHTTMSMVGEKLGALLDPAAEASRQLGESARALREIGTPELLAGQVRHQEQIARMADLAVSHGEHLSVLDNRISEGRGAILEHIGVLDERAKQADATRQEQFAEFNNRITQEAGALNEKLAANDQRIKSLDANLLRATQGSATSAANTTKLLKILGYALAGIIVVQAVALAWLLKWR